MTKQFSLKALMLTGLFSLATLPLAHAASPTKTEALDKNMVTSAQFTAANYQPQDASKMFPAPKQGMVQHILTLPALDNEQNYLVEVQVGQTKMVDCNKHGLRGELKEVDLEGWGYTYYEVSDIADGHSTMMACPEKALQEAFVTIGGEHKFRYNSKLPMVFYIPQGAELKYRVWRADPEFTASAK